MNSAIGNSILFYIAIFIMIIIMFFVVGSISYSKAYKVKNRIIQSIENSGSYEAVKKEITEDLKTYGYQTYIKQKCDKVTVNGVEYENLNDTSYRYCVYKIYLDNKASNNAQTTLGSTTALDNTTDDNSANINSGYYYKVITYTHFDLPIIQQFIEFGINGETKILGKKYNYD